MDERTVPGRPVSTAYGMMLLPSPHPWKVVWSEDQIPPGLRKMTNTIIINFGAPRSGTTFMQLCLKRLDNIITLKLPEMRSFHPCKSKTGLLELARWLKWSHLDLTMVRTIRHPLELVESFEAARFHPDLRDRVGGLAKNTDANVCRWIRSESENYHDQAEALRELCRVVEVRYEALADKEQAKQYARQIYGNKDQVLIEAFDGFGGTAVRSGRLMFGIGKVLTDDRRAWFEKELWDVIQREGYA